MVGFQEGKPVNVYFICAKSDPREFEDVPKSIFHAAPLVFGCKNLHKEDTNFRLQTLISFKF